MKKLITILSIVFIHGMVVGQGITSLPINHVFTPVQGAPTLNPGCVNVCNASSNYHLRTGYAGYNTSATEIPNGIWDTRWKIVENPCEGTDLLDVNEIVIVAETPDYFDAIPADLDGSGIPYDEVKYVRPGGTCVNQPGTYKYQTKFCLSDNATGVALNLMCLADNRAKVWLNGNLIADQGSTEDGMTIANMINATVTDAGLFILGENTLEIEVYNVPSDQQGGVSSTGMMAYLDVSVGQGCVGCCNDKGVIWGVKYNDLNADGVWQEGEPPLAGVTFKLYEGAILRGTTTSDESGFFVFSDLDNATYKVVEEAFGTWTCTSPTTMEYTGLVIEPFTVISNLQFLNAETLASAPCNDCGDSFTPIPGERYWISAWVQVVSEDEPLDVKTYFEALDGPFLRTIFLGTSEVVPEFYPSGEIIDGWQRIVGSFTVPSGGNNFLLTLNAHPTYDTYFDDIRIHPFNGSMKSYVYDGETFWLTSELDDNNYATFYEYDEEGGLIRIKKETSRGIVTIQETRSNTVKKEE